MQILEKISDNKALIGILAIIGGLSGIMALVMGWSDFYNEVLSIPIQLPLWVLVLLLLAGLSVYYYVFVKEKKPKKLKTIKGENFFNEKVILDHHEYVNCKFERCELIFYAEGLFKLKGCEFLGNELPKVTFRGKAGDTLGVQKILYNNGFAKHFEEFFTEPEGVYVNHPGLGKTRRGK